MRLLAYGRSCCDRSECDTASDADPHAHASSEGDLPGLHHGEQRLVHHHRELHLVLEVQRRLGRVRAPLELLQHPRHHQRDVRRAHGQPGADPPPRAERYHPDAGRPRHVRGLAARQEPVRVELRGPVPQLGVLRDGREEDVQVGVRGHVVPRELAPRLDGGVGEREVRGRVLPEELFDEGLEVRHVVGVLVVDRPGVADLLHDLLVDPGLDGRVVHDARHGPLDGRGRGVGAAVDQLRAQGDQLVVRALVALDTEVQHGVQVREGRGHVRVSWRRRFLLHVAEDGAAAVDEREERVDLLASDGEHPALLAPEQGAEEREVVVHAHADGEQHALHDGVDVHDVLLVQVQQAEGHVQEDAEHREARVAEHPHGGPVRGRRGLGAHPGHEPVHGAQPRGAELPEPRRAEHPGHHVPPQRPPLGAVNRGVDGELVGGEDVARGVLGGPAGELLPLLDERLVHQLGAADDDERAHPHPQRQDGPVLAPQVADVVDERLPGEGHLEEVPDDGPPGRPRREPQPPILPLVPHHDYRHGQHRGGHGGREGEADQGGCRHGAGKGGTRRLLHGHVWRAAMNASAGRDWGRS
uniref:Uncharacterized protein n=1 Tax=Avena sativa TaxID=4498 RepID=A0ACD5UXB6_AVESA